MCSVETNSGAYVGANEVLCVNVMVYKPACLRACAHARSHWYAPRVPIRTARAYGNTCHLVRHAVHKVEPLPDSQHGEDPEQRLCRAGVLPIRWRGVGVSSLDVSSLVFAPSLFQALPRHYSGTATVLLRYYCGSTPILLR